jgi:hypothetical protein
LLDDLSKLIADDEKLELEIFSVYAGDQENLERQLAKLRERKLQLTRLLQLAIANLDRGR